MKEFQKANHAFMYPQRCFCGACSPSQPVVDTFMEYDQLPARGRVYFGPLCATRIARAAGLIEGDEYHRLIEADKHLGHLQKEVESRDEKIKNQAATIRQRNQEIVNLKAEIETLQGNLKMREDAIKDMTERARSVAIST